MITIKIPVTVGKRETLIKSTDIELELLDKTFKIRKRYIKETPKDPDDEYSPCEERLWEVNATIRKDAISLICWAWEWGWEVYQVEVNLTSGESYNFNMGSKELAIELYEKLLYWWL